LGGRSGVTVTITGRNLRRTAEDAPASTLTVQIPLDGSVAPTVRDLVERGGEIEEVRREARGLEEIFLQIVREGEP
jgi:hypothetical protein